MTWAIKRSLYLEAQINILKVNISVEKSSKSACVCVCGVCVYYRRQTTSRGGSIRQAVQTSSSFPAVAAVHMAPVAGSWKQKNGPEQFWNRKELNQLYTKGTGRRSWWRWLRKNRLETWEESQGGRCPRGNRGEKVLRRKELHRTEARSLQPAKQLRYGSEYHPYSLWEKQDLL